MGEEWDSKKGFPHNPDCPGTHYIDRAGLYLRDLPALPPEILDISISLFVLKLMILLFSLEESTVQLFFDAPELLVPPL